jgi:CheY-like chemotaxis protein
MPEGGTLIIQTGNVVFDDAYASRHVDVHPGEHTMLVISDTGVGMDEEIKAHLFEPFFTTKERGQGTGLGLPTVFGIVTQNGGHIEVDSQPGQGTTIAIYLPVADRTKKPRSAPSRSMTSAETKLVRGTETVLVVEDEQTVRDLAVQVLKSCGYQVLAASNGQDALQINEQHDGPIHLLLTDVVMPQMSGGELANRLQELRPEMRVLYMSGYADDTIIQRGVLSSSAAFVSKPLTIEELTQRVRAVLDGRI